MEKVKPHLKAWEIQNLPREHAAVFMEWLDPVVLAINEHSARLKALNQLKDYDIQEDEWGTELTYITIRLKRDPEHDNFLIDGRLKNKFEIDQDKEKADRDAGFRKLLSDNPDGFAYIRKGGSYYRPNNCGYTEFRQFAGVYTLRDAVNECLGMSLRECMYPILIDPVEHNTMINKEIDLLKEKLIPIKQS